MILGYDMMEGEKNCCQKKIKHMRVRCGLGWHNYGDGIAKRW